MLIEQAIFTSERTDRGPGYQIVAASPGLREVDARELASRSPSHGSLIDPGPTGASSNFYRLASGDFCLARTTAAGQEYSGRGGFRVYTQNLVVTPAVLAAFANNPMSLMRAATAKGLFEVRNIPVQQLSAIHLPGRATMFDEPLVRHTVRMLGLPTFLDLVHAALRDSSLACYGPAPCEVVFAALLNVLPFHSRVDFSFSTGLRFSQRRPFRLLGVGMDGDELRRLRRIGAATFDLANRTLPDSKQPPVGGWAQFVASALSGADCSLLVEAIVEAPPAMSHVQLDAWGESWLSKSAQRNTSTTAEAPRNAHGDTDSNVRTESQPNAPRANTIVEGSSTWRDHAATQQPPAPWHTLTAAFPQTLLELSPATTIDALANVKQPALSAIEKLETVDDLVFGAIAGHREAMPQLRAAWPAAIAELDPDLTEQSREQYLRYALRLWKQSAEQGAHRDPAKAVAALDVLCLLFE